MKDQSGVNHKKYDSRMMRHLDEVGRMLEYLYTMGHLDEVDRRFEVGTMCYQFGLLALTDIHLLLVDTMYCQFELQELMDRNLLGVELLSQYHQKTHHCRLEMNNLDLQDSLSIHCDHYLFHHYTEKFQVVLMKVSSLSLHKPRL